MLFKRSFKPNNRTGGVISDHTKKKIKSAAFFDNGNSIVAKLKRVLLKTK